MQKIYLSGVSLTKSVLYVLNTIYMILEKVNRISSEVENN